MKTYSFIGDQALWGAWKARVRVASGYPGYPATRSLEHLAQISRRDEVHAKSSANEKVAVEIVVGASMGGKRAVGAMKSVGLNVAMEGWINAQGKVFSICIDERPFFKQA